MILRLCLLRIAPSLLLRQSIVEQMELRKMNVTNSSNATGMKRVLHPNVFINPKGYTTHWPQNLPNEGKKTSPYKSSTNRDLAKSIFPMDCSDLTSLAHSNTFGEFTLITNPTVIMLMTEAMDNKVTEVTDNKVMEVILILTVLPNPMVAAILITLLSLMVAVIHITLLNPMVAVTLMNQPRNTKTKNMEVKPILKLLTPKIMADILILTDLPNPMVVVILMVHPRPHLMADILILMVLPNPMVVAILMVHPRPHLMADMESPTLQNLIHLFHLCTVTKEATKVQHMILVLHHLTVTKEATKA